MTPQLLREQEAALAPLRPLHAYEALFSDAWAGRVAVRRERCLAAARARGRAGSRYEYEYATRGGWVEIRDGKRMPQPQPKTRQMSSE